MFESAAPKRLPDMEVSAGNATRFSIGIKLNYGNISRYVWDFGNGDVVQATTNFVDYTYEKCGAYNASVKVVGEFNRTVSAFANVRVRPQAVSWCSFQAGPDHSGFLPYAEIPKNPSVLWRTSTPVISYPVTSAENNAIYFISVDGFCNAIGASDGREVWKTRIFGELGNGIFSIPDNMPAIAYDSNRVFAGTDDGCVICLNASDGTRLWKTRAGFPGILGTGALVSGSISVKRGVVFAVSGQQPFGENSVTDLVAMGRKSSGGAFAIDAASGQTIWSFFGPFYGGIGGSAVSAANCCIYGSTDGNFYSIKNSNAALKTSSDVNWNFQIRGTPAYPPAVLGRTVLVPAENDGLYAIDDSSGNVFWHFGAVDRSGQSESTASAIFNKMAYVGFGKSLYCLNISNGNPIWNFESDVTFESPPVVADGKVLAQDSGGCIYILDAFNGSVIWEGIEQGSGSIGPVVFKDMFLVCSECKEIVCYGSPDLLE
ncbi:MAG: PQQ-binding-like beta-propeller repeat protein [Candidatus Thermoplasmatota archaeon]|nr:PQQ-binding-like beta-propeller repeat protein [Candidatus Thermoplasmatota archaeon]